MHFIVSKGHLTMKILLIEDNLRLVERVTHYLGKSFIIDTANTGKQGLAKATTGNYTVILLDLNLPDMHGSEICQRLRKAKVNTAILIISGVKDIDSRITLLNYGADDYLVKPFNPGELIARIHALFRRQNRGYNEHILMVKDLTIDVNKRQVERAGQSISLRRKEFDILEYLVANQGRPVSREMILNHAWDGGNDSWHNTIDVHVKYLRDKVDRPFNSPLIKTAYGVGYMIDDTT